MIITENGRFVVIENTECNIKVMFDGKHMAVVDVPYAGYSGLITGLCGNCNRDKSDDYADRDGNLIDSGRKFHHLIGNSYEVPGVENVYVDISNSFNLTIQKYFSFFYQMFPWNVSVLIQFEKLP